MPRRKRSDSAAMQAEALHRAAAGVEPPACVTLDADVRPFWDAIVAMKLEWLTNDLVLAAQLARIQYDIEYYSRLVRDGGRINPDDAKLASAHKILKDLTGDAVRLCRTLQIHPHATQGQSRDQVKRNQLSREAQATVAGVGNLIAKPTVH